jgi:hypothetical protein
LFADENETLNLALSIVFVLVFYCSGADELRRTKTTAGIQDRVNGIFKIEIS